MTRILTERDQFRSDTAELLKSKRLIEKQYTVDKAAAKDREVKL